MSKPESSFIAGVHKHLPAHVYREKMNNPYRGGTPDVWYSGRGTDLWVEYKFLPRLPVYAAVVPDLSALQLQWLRDRWAEGRSVRVIMGCPEGGVLLDNRTWESPIDNTWFRERLISRKELAQKIESIVDG